MWKIGLSIGYTSGHTYWQISLQGACMIAQSVRPRWPLYCAYFRELLKCMDLPMKDQKHNGTFFSIFKEA